MKKKKFVIKSEIKRNRNECDCMFLFFTKVFNLSHFEKQGLFLI